MQLACHWRATDMQVTWNRPATGMQLTRNWRVTDVKPACNWWFNWRETGVIMACIWFELILHSYIYYPVQDGAYFRNYNWPIWNIPAKSHDLNLKVPLFKFRIIYTLEPLLLFHDEEQITKVSRFYVFSFFLVTVNPRFTGLRFTVYSIYRAPFSFPKFATSISKVM